MKKIVFLISSVILFASVFVFFNGSVDNAFIMNGRISRLFALLLTSITIAYATIVFQTISGNKIVTPSLMGYEYLFVLLQVMILLLFGTDTTLLKSRLWGFLFSTAVMIGYSLVLYVGLFRKYTHQVYFILLVGLILGIFFNSTTQFLQMTVDPNKFAYIQSAMFSTLTRVTIQPLAFALLLISAVFVFLFPDLKYLDVLNLGRNYAIGLGVDYDRLVQKQLLGISILVAVSTALIGPITFVGIFVSGITYRLSNTSRHRVNIFLAVAVCFILMICAQFIVEHILNYKHSLSVLINLLGSIYFIMIILKLLKK